MDNLTINAIKRIAINDDENRVIEFDPTDVVFFEKYCRLLDELTTKGEEYEAYLKKLDEESDDDMLKNIEDGISYLRETCIYLRGKIDQVFGDETSQKAFGDTLSYGAIKQFFEGTSKFIFPEREEKIAKYSGKKNSNVMK